MEVKRFVKSKITVEDLSKLFDQLKEFNKDDNEVHMYHPCGRENLVVPVCLEEDDSNDVFGAQIIVFKKYKTCTGSTCWKLETDIDIVDKY